MASTFNQDHQSIKNIPQQKVNDQIMLRNLEGKKEKIIASREYYVASNYDLILRGNEKPKDIANKLLFIKPTNMGTK